MKMGSKMMRVIALSRGNGCGVICLSFIFKRAMHQKPISSRLKREDVAYIVHDSLFSPWKILAGASDWENHSSGKEGSERYRTQNLPNYTSPGDYELGILSTSASRSEPRRIDPSLVVPVYLGQAENVRARLQSYGRGGAHLEKDLRLFSHTFSTNFPIVYRWAPTISKKEAEEREEELLRKYDYAWNKRNNGDRRPHEIRTRLSHEAPLLSVFRRVVLRHFHLGGKINHREFWR